MTSPSPPPILIVPGFGNSGPGHWQTLWAAALPTARRVELGEWDAPSRDTWVAALDDAIAKCTTAPVVVAHSLGVLAVAWWAGLHARPVRSALLVTPPDLACQHCVGFPQVRAFGAPPLKRLPFPTILAASSTDPYCELARARLMAEAWGAEIADLGASGHVNTESGHGPWPAGERLLAKLQM